MIQKHILLSILISILSFSVNAQKDVSSKSTETIKEFKEKSSKVAELFSSAYGYAVFPNIGKGGIGIGGANGNGTVYRNGAVVGDCRMTQVSIGFQFGGQRYAEVIFFENEDSYHRFVEGNFEFAAQVSAVALASGASADAKYRDGVLVFTQALGGLMYEASVGGQKFKIKMR
ncbi:hypothetical protein N9L92_03035 [Saprospiraceae bacterium]|nr:hypothetical protein [Saprospiraceae bacterium]